MSRKTYTESEKQSIRIGYLRKNKKGMEEDLFDNLSTAELNTLFENGNRKLTLQERFKDNFAGIAYGAIVIAVIAYTVITALIMQADYNSISKVSACELVKKLELPKILPEQSISIEKTGNELGARTDCWVKLKSNGTELVAVASISAGYDKKYPSTNSTSGERNDTTSQIFSFKDNFYEGDVTAYQTVPKSASVSDDIVIAERLLANEVGKQMMNSLPKNEHIETVRRGIIWGWLVPIFFESKVQGSIPAKPEDKQSIAPKLLACDQLPQSYIEQVMSSTITKKEESNSKDRSDAQCYVEGTIANGPNWILTYTVEPTAENKTIHVDKQDSSLGVYYSYVNGRYKGTLTFITQGTSPADEQISNDLTMELARSLQTK